MPAPEKQQPRLVDACEPVFTMVCDLNRLGRAGGSKALEVVAHDVDRAFAEVQGLVGRSNHLERQFKEVEPALCCFVDSMIENGSLSIAREWRNRRLAEARFEILTGEDSFFDDYLDKELEQPASDADAVERLEVYFACLYLGFEGKYAGSPDLQRVQSKVAGRVRQLLGTGRPDRVTPDAYKYLNTTPLNIPTAPAIWGAVILSVFFVILFVVGTGYMYRLATQQLADAVNSINSSK